MKILKNILIKSIFFLMIIFAGLNSYAQKAHPCLILTKNDALEIRKHLGKLPLLDKSFNELKAKIDAELEQKMDVPVPKDPAGGYTHEKHKQNYLAMQGAGVLWQITQDKKYAEFVKKMLLKYAELYPTLGIHPVKKSYAPGKLFWQSLNEAVWMAYTSQAYDCIYEYLKNAERDKIENDLLIPYANFLSTESPNVFNRIHNHGVWAVAAVGMAGFAMENKEIINRAFNGVPPFENEDGLKPGFLTQINELFSPDGYYTEGPYYQRYAILPYILFAQAIDNNKPEIKIFQQRDKILQKAVLATLQLTNSNGKYFPINDAVKSMSFLSPELIAGLDIVYNQNPTNYELLSIAQKQDEVIISGAGLKVAQDIALNKAKPFKWKSVEFSDGSDGSKGAIGILRSGHEKNLQSIAMKYASQGMGHGHYDRLSMIYYDNGNEILQDYGAARFVNVFYKHGGRYLPENESWAKQTIAHNTVIVDTTSQFNDNLDTANKYNSEKWFFDASQPNIQIMSAKENKAYKGVEQQRTIAVINDKTLFDNSLIIDVFRIESEKAHTYDLPFYYQGQLMYTNIDYKAHTIERSILGPQNGYQHLWVEAEGKTESANFQFLFFNDNRFYSITSESDTNTYVYFTRIGANDPEFNLRNEPGLMIRQQNSKNHVFVSAIESHGRSNPVTELTSNLKSSLKYIKTILDDKNYTIIELETTNNKIIQLAISNNNAEAKKEHFIRVNSKEYKWVGPYKLFKN